MRSHFSLQNTIQSTNKCLHFVASGNTHVILGEAVRVKEKKLKVEEKKRKRKKSKKDSSTVEGAASPNQSSSQPLVPSSVQCPVQSAVQASAVQGLSVSNSSPENNYKIPCGSKRPLVHDDLLPVQKYQLPVENSQCNTKRFKNAENLDEKV